jgi:hypothetical protein
MYQGNWTRTHHKLASWQGEFEQTCFFHEARFEQTCVLPMVARAVPKAVPAEFYDAHMQHSDTQPQWND